MAKRRKQTRLRRGGGARPVVTRLPFATVSPEGVPHLVPVCAVLNGQKLCFGSGDDATKIRNLKANPSITVTVDEYSEHWAGLKGVMVQGRGRLIERGPSSPVPAIALREVPAIPRGSRARRVGLDDRRGDAG